MNRMRAPMPAFPLWLVPVPGGHPRRIGNLRGVLADASPDGRRSRPRAAASGSCSPRSTADAEQRACSPFVPCGPSWPRWAPDGRRIRFTAVESGSRESTIWETLDPRRAALDALWPGATTAAGRPTADHFLFERRTEIVVRRRDEPPLARGASASRCGSRSARSAYGQVGPSPDGRRLFAFGTSFARRADEARPERRRQFAPALGGESAFYAEPSPDGQWLAWVRYPEGTLWRSRPDGSERLQLTSTPHARRICPAGRPTGQRLVFVWRGSPERSAARRAGSWLRTPRPRRRSPAPRSRTSTTGTPAGCPTGRSCSVTSYLVDAGRTSCGSTRRPGASSASPGAEGLRYPKCSRQGDVLADQWARPGTTGSSCAGRARPPGRTWSSRPAAGPFSYPSWRRDGRSFCGLARDGQRDLLLGRRPPARRPGQHARAPARVLDGRAVDGPRRGRHAVRHRRSQHPRPLRARLGGAVGAHVGGQVLNCASPGRAQFKT